MNKYKTKKQFGQNFIKNKNLLKKIVSFIDVKENDLVIEIGLGQGDLSAIILSKNSNYIGFEIDEDLKVYLDRFSSERSEIVFADFLKIDIKDYLKNRNYSNLYIISNLPYYITTPIINKIINENIQVNKMLLMVQKEVGERFTAIPGTKSYGSITVHLNYFYNIKKVLFVGKENFLPKPKVDSVVLLFEKKENEEEIDLDFFQKLLRDSFQFKRKNIRNNLREYDLVIVNNVLQKHKFDLNSRAEELPINVFIELTQKLSK